LITVVDHETLRRTSALVPGLNLVIGRHRRASRRLGDLDSRRNRVGVA